MNVMQHSVSTEAPSQRSTVKPWITCVVPAYNESEGIAVFLNSLCAHLSGLTDRYDVIVVDDGSKDNTGLEVIAASGGLPIQLIGLSRNFGKEAAISAGLEEAEGEVVVILDADFQHPFPVIDEFINHWQQGYEMVYAIRTDRKTDPPVRRGTRRAPACSCSASTGPTPRAARSASSPAGGSTPTRAAASTPCPSAPPA